MKAYLQGPGGEESELQIVPPDSNDGTFVIPLGQLPAKSEELTGDPAIDDTWWVRIVPFE